MQTETHISSSDFDGGPEKRLGVGGPIQGTPTVQADSGWSLDMWRSSEEEVRVRALSSGSELGARKVASRWGRKVLRSYSSSFFTVTRFLPADKRADVEMVYAAVRFPDEVVDTFPLSEADKLELLDEWKSEFERSAQYGGIVEGLEAGIPVTIAGFRDVARRNEIPDEHYLSFLGAMRADTAPRVFTDWDDLLESYIYGSATVVGYFLAHIYGAAPDHTVFDCLEASRDLAIALQLTNFARDVSDDAARGRCYLPADQLGDGAPVIDGVLAGDLNAMLNAKIMLANEATRWYERAEKGFDSFNADSRIAIEACHRLYSRLNESILLSESAFERESLSMREKLSALPVSKYWRLPAAMLLER